MYTLDFPHYPRFNFYRVNVNTDINNTNRLQVEQSMLTKDAELLSHDNAYFKIHMGVQQ